MGLGDLHPKGSDPLETYFDIVRQGVKLPRRRWIVKPEWSPPSIPGLGPGEGAPGQLSPVQRLIEDHFIPRMWQLLADLWTKFQCGTYFIKSPNWIEPPITGRCLDLRTEECVTAEPQISTPTFPVNGYDDNQTSVVEFTVPDGYVGTILGFGHALVDVAQWGLVIWNITVNGTPVPCYQNFIQQIGDFENPTLFPNPIKLKHGDKLEVTVSNQDLADACVFVRLTGFVFPAKMLTQDGSYNEYHTI